ncbi:MAG: aminotransferase, partial [Burkholderiales bacterium]|nr:aminotransferase [Burkholderiales bacterium]
MAAIAPFQVMEVQRRAFELEAQGRCIIHMEIGQPDFSAPPQVVEAAVAAIRNRSLEYTGALGLPALREAIAAYYG